MSYVAMRRMGCAPCQARAQAGMSGASMRSLAGLSGMWWPDASEGWVDTGAAWLAANPEITIQPQYVYIISFGTNGYSWSFRDEAGQEQSGVVPNGTLNIPPTAVREHTVERMKRWGIVGLSVATLGGLIAGVHGYRRNGGSIGWGLGWGLLGALLPIVTVPVALAQGYGKRSR